LSRTFGPRKSAFIEENRQPWVLLPGINHLGPGGAGFDTGRVSAAEVALEHLSRRGHIDRAKGTGRYTFHALDALALVNDGRIGNRVIVEGISGTHLRARRGVGAVVTNSGHKPKAVLRYLGSHFRGVLDFEACPDRIQLALGRVDQGASYLTDLAVGAEVFEGEKLFFNVQQ
jgi:hypothetical protein